MEYTQIRDAFINNLSDYERQTLIILTNTIFVLQNNSNDFLNKRHRSSKFNILDYQKNIDNPDTIIHFANYMAEEYRQVHKFQFILQAINSTERINSHLVNCFPKFQLFINLVVLMNIIRSKLEAILADEKNYINHLCNLKQHLYNNNLREERFAIWNNVLHYIQYRSIESIFSIIGSDIESNKTNKTNKTNIRNKLNTIIQGYREYNNITSLTICISPEQYENIYNAFVNFTV
jgi:hypothetical protein